MGRRLCVVEGHRGEPEESGVDSGECKGSYYRYGFVLLAALNTTNKMKNNKHFAAEILRSSRGIACRDPLPAL